MQIQQPKVEDMRGDERYFQIRDCDRRGCGSFYYFTVTRDTPINEIMEIAAQEHSSTMINKDESYYPTPFKIAPHWRSTLKVVELKRVAYKLDPVNDIKKIARTESNFGSNWSTLRGGLKFTIRLNHTKIKTNLATHSYKRYTPGEIE